jgi:hypothetical protein
VKAEGKRGGGEGEHGGCGLRAARGAELDQVGVAEGTAGGAWRHAVRPDLGHEGWL